MTRRPLPRRDQGSSREQFDVKCVAIGVDERQCDFGRSTAWDLCGGIPEHGCDPGAHVGLGAEVALGSSVVAQRRGDAVRAWGVVAVLGSEPHGSVPARDDYRCAGAAVVPIDGGGVVSPVPVSLALPVRMARPSSSEVTTSAVTCGAELAISTDAVSVAVTPADVSMRTWAK